MLQAFGEVILSTSFCGSQGGGPEQWINRAQTSVQDDESAGVSYEAYLSREQETKPQAAVHKAILALVRRQEVG